MNNTRIRYVYSGVIGEHKSSRNFEVGSKSLSVRLNLGMLTFKIVDDNTNETLQSGGENTEALLKKSAKNALARLGVAFGSESRARQPKEQAVS